jgi:dihydroxyacetone kinase
LQDLNAISKSTYPVLVNEVGGLSNEKYYVIVEMIKHAVENQNARGKFVDGSYNNIPALITVALVNPSSYNSTV